MAQIKIQDRVNYVRPEPEFLSEIQYQYTLAFFYQEGSLQMLASPVIITPKREIKQEGQIQRYLSSQYFGAMDIAFS